MTSLFMWCMSGVPCVLDGKCALMTSLLMLWISSVPQLFNRITVIQCAR